MQPYPGVIPPDEDDETLRAQVLRTLAQHPLGLTPGEIASQLAVMTPLTRVLRDMAEKGLVRRVSGETYAVLKA